MALTVKDLLTTILALVVTGFAYLTISGYQLPLISGYRWATGVLLVLGIIMCSLGSPSGMTFENPWMIATTILGIISLIIIIAGLIMGIKTVFLAVAGTILILWALSTIRHLIGG